MSPEALVLALTTVVRPSSAAAVYAMLSTHRPQRLLVAYILAGLAFSLTIGALAVLALQGHSSSSTATAGRALLNIVIGAAALGYAAGAWTGRVHRRAADPADESWMQRRLRHLTPPVAALAGVLTHLPGLVYLAALNAIIGTASGPVNGILQVLVYNALWFSLAIVALVMSVYRPSVSRDLLERGTAWARRHQRTIVVVFCGVLGLYLVVKGVVDLRALP
ncbi:GAP family protein [Pseudonocardia acaciae]|uniref:GAP family protein n=1 Tax=Pseudonocardia acaciae TaxID=551276 RepID=UPI00048AA749|nr:GAP family protein [Pseudonocardia acaciae]